MISKNRPGSMAMMRSYSAALRPGIDDRKESLIAHAPSTASSSPGFRHTESVLIQPLRNKVSPSTDKERDEKHYSQSVAIQHQLHENWLSTLMSRRVQVHLLSEVREDRSDRATHSIQNLF